ncbi:pre-mRNA-processing factor 39 [Cimex lectularius]|uniref:Pre-mRNA-processing factor 39 n=1 Tax=Cimex lectularius TaxID=79782 RepID=A0A8I6TCR8_CIMLE|nr:pre-mRNA-processing factor 39 [Cimex lectularius]
MMSEEEATETMDAEVERAEDEAPALRRSGRRGRPADEHKDDDEDEPVKKKLPRGRKPKRGRSKRKATVEEEPEEEEPLQEDFGPMETERLGMNEKDFLGEDPMRDEPTQEEPVQGPMPEPTDTDDVQMLAQAAKDRPNEAHFTSDTNQTKEVSEERPSGDKPDSEEGEVNDMLEHHDTEMVSEDELPSDGPKAPLDTEAVSDEELPGPTQAELLDTEAVSEDELPPVKKKRKHRRHSSDSDKRVKPEKDKDSSKRSRDSESPVSRKEKERSLSSSRMLPELDKYWKAVKEDPSDFTGWTYLLQYVDQENDVDAAREAYDKFLQHYPYCYGYWRKYADYEKRKGGELTRCEKVFERGLNAIPLSVDLWLHYLNFCKSLMKDDEEKLRAEFERAIEQCGLEFRSDRLWDCYIKWEMEVKNYQNAYALYHRLLATPTQGYKTHFESYEDFVRSHHPNKILKVDEFLELRSEVVQKIKEKGLPILEPTAAPPGDESDGEEEPKSAHTDEETALMRDKIISIGKKIFKDTISEVITRWNYEEGIKRPYFHVKPLERCQLNTWREYLDYEIGVGSEKRTVVLFERCLIACALYEEFWVKYIKYLESLPGNREEEIRKVYQRACLIHHPKKPYLALNWASFEECHKNVEGARRVLIQIEKEVPSMMLVHLRRINLERRSGNLEEAGQLYEYYLANTKSRSVFVTLSVKYSRFCWKILNDPSKGVDVLKRAIDKNPDDIRLYVQLLDLLMLEPNSDENECIKVFDRIIERESVDIEDKLIFAQRRIEFLEDFGFDIESVQKAQTEYFSIMKQLKEARRHKKSDDKAKSDEKKKDSQLSSNSYSSSTYSNPPTTYSSSYQGSGQYSQQSYNQPSQNSSYSASDQNSYQNYYSQSNYNNSNQSWGGYNYYS